VREQGLSLGAWCRAFANTPSCCAAGTSSFAGLWLAEGCPASCCLGVAALLVLNSGLPLAACSLVIKTTDVVPAGFPLKDKRWSRVSCDVDVRLDCGLVSAQGVELRGLLAVSGQMGPISNRSSLPPVSCAPQFVLGLWEPGRAQVLSRVL